MGVDQVIALVTFVAVGSGSPGPNNTLLLASGAGFGFRRTVPHVIGTAVGISLLVVIAAAGAAAVVTAAPGVEFVMKVLASAYLLYLAFRLAGGVAVDRVSTPEPFSLPRGAAFQLINPKGWFFAFAVVAGFTPSERSLVHRCDQSRDHRLRGGGDGCRVGAGRLGAQSGARHRPGPPRRGCGPRAPAGGVGGAALGVTSAGTLRPWWSGTARSS